MSLPGPEARGQVRGGQRRAGPQRGHSPGRGGEADQALASLSLGQVQTKVGVYPSTAGV